MNTSQPAWIKHLLTLQRLLTPARKRYPWLIGAALWAAWLLSLALGQVVQRAGPTDRFGQLFGTDFVAFYTAGKIVDRGQSAELYNLDTAHEIQQDIYQRESDNFNPYLNPPFYALVFVPFSKLPYLLAAALWMLLNLACLWFSVRLLTQENSSRKTLLALTWLPAWSAITFGQNAFLSLLILSATYTLWSRNRNLLAGITAGLMLYKPQLAIGIGLLWLIDARRSWKSLLGMALSAFCLVAISIALFPEASLAYVDYALRINANLMTFPGFPIWNAHGVQTFFFGILPDSKEIAQLLYYGCALVGIGVFFRFLRQHEDRFLRFAAAVCLTIWVTPYVMIYDWSILLIPALLLWQGKPNLQQYWQVLFAFMWVVMLISTPLAAVSLQFLGVALQISIPTLAITLGAAYQISALNPGSTQANGEPI